MSTLRLETLRMPGASLGDENPLPDLRGAMDAHAEIAVDHETVTDEEARYMGWGRISSILPYLMQDGYDRKQCEKAFPTAVLENEHLRATFLLSLGGRLWSLYDRDEGRELLYVNPVFQSANLALRNAWFSGGVEWNCGIIGHTPFTCSDMCAEQLTLSDGTPVLRLFQYERVRHLLYRVEACLPQGERQLLVRVAISNVLKEDTAIYWWSNMAVPEREDIRVIVPADRAFRYGYGGCLSKVPVPYMTAEADKLRGQARRLAEQQGGTLDWDVSHATCLPQSMDFFFDIPSSEQPWIAEVDGDGYGLCQTSTSGLRGRKLFAWGMGKGGRHWQTFLSEKGSRYMEIQAGLAHTQLEHLPFPGHGSLSWLESYGPLRVDGSIAQGRDWHAAVGAVRCELQKTRSEAVLDAWHEKMARELDRRAGQTLRAAPCFLPSERLMHPDLVMPAVSPDSMAESAEEAPWRTLAAGAALPCPDPLDPPLSYQRDAVWEKALRSSLERPCGDHWYAHYQLGVMAHLKGRTEEARDAYEKSLERARNPWALRGLGLLSDQAGETEAAETFYLEAAKSKPIRPLVLETLGVMLRRRNFAGMEELIRTLPESLQSDGRVRTYLALARLRAGDPEGAEAILRGDLVLTDVREGDTLLTDIWFEIAALKQFGEVTEAGLAWASEHVSVPEHLDFRML